MGLPLTATTPSTNCDRVATMLARAGVNKALQEQGVNCKAAMERVQAMSGGEDTQLAGRLDQAPVGGDVLGVLFTI